MHVNPNSGGISLPAPSSAERIPPLSSRGHATGHLVVESGTGPRILLVESDLELKWATILDADSDVEDIREQVRLDWSDCGRARTHYFDFVVKMRSGQRVAMIVKPAKRARKDAFLAETRKIAEHVQQSGFAEETRVLTDECIDPISLQNARLFQSVRAKDERADDAVNALAKGLAGAVPISELIPRLGLGARGFRGIVRGISLGQLVCLDHEAISPATFVRGSGFP